jgi:hypothetical protein
MARGSFSGHDGYAASFHKLARKRNRSRGSIGYAGLTVTNTKEFVITAAMTAKNLEQLIERVRRWPKQRQEDAAEVLLEMERQDTSGYRLTDAQVQEVARIQLEVREGRATFATDEQMAALWKSCGL